MKSVQKLILTGRQFSKSSQLFTFYQKVASSFIQEDNSNQESVEKMISVKLEFVQFLWSATRSLNTL